MPAVVLLGSCGTDTASQPQTEETDNWQVEFSVRGGTQVAGQTGDCVEGWRDDEFDLDNTDVPVAYVELSNEEGEGTREDPYGSLARALVETRGSRRILFLAPGEYRRPEDLSIESPVALIGSCAANTVVKGPAEAPVLPLGDVDGAVLQHVWLQGGSSGVRAEEVRRLILSQTRISGANTGLHLRDVLRADVIDSAIVESTGRNVVSLDSALRLKRSIVGRGGTGGIVSGMDVSCDEVSASECRDRLENALTECSGRGPWCPYSGFLFVDRSIVQRTDGVGIRSRHGVLRVRRSRVEWVLADDGDTAAGLRATESFAVIDDGTVVSSVEGRSIHLRSSRAHLA